MSSNINSRQRGSNSFLVQGSILAATSILVRVIGLIYRIPMTRIIGNEGMGYYEYAFEIYNFCFIISSYGMPMAVSKLVAERTAKKEYRNSMHIFIGALLISIVTGGALSLAVYFGAAFISSSFFANPAIEIPLRALAPTIVTASVLGVIRGLFQGKNTMIPTALSQLIEQIINGIVSVVAAYELTKAHSASPNIAAYGATGGVTGTFLGAFFGLIFVIFVFIVNVPMFKRQVRRDISPSESMGQIIKIILYTVIPVMLSQILVRSNGIIAITLFNNILSGKGISKEEYTVLYGIYGSKYLLLCNIVIGITSAITTAMIPSLVKENTLGSSSGVSAKASLALKFNLIIAIPSAVGLSILGGPIIRLLFGDTDPLISNIMLVGSITIVFYTVSILFNTIIQSIHDMKIPVINSAIAIALDCPLLFVLLKYTNLNVYALVIGNLAMPVVVIILDGIVLKRRLKIKFNIARTVIIPTVSSLIMGIAVFISYKALLNINKSYIIALLISVIIGAVLFFVLEIALKGITKKELYSFPGGGILVKIATRLHLMK